MNVQLLLRLPILLLCTTLIGRADEPSDALDGPWLPDPLGSITEKFEEADLPAGFRLTEPHKVTMEIRGDATCYFLQVGEYSLGSIANPMRAGDGLVFEKCESLKCADDRYCFLRDMGKECNHGWLRGWFVATGRDETMRELEDLGWFSNPVPCESRLAYWVFKNPPEHATDSRYFAYVADVESGAILRKEFMGQAWIGTDNAFHLSVARWRPDCSQVVFHDERYFPPKTLNFRTP